MESSAFIALGSNLNLDGVSSLELIKKAIIELEKSNFNLQAISRFFKNPAFPIGSGPDFVNAVVKNVRPGFVSCWPIHPTKQLYLFILARFRSRKSVK